jgi:uncharacterized protein (TIGR03085 family)
VTSLAATERAQLAALADQLGPDAPTLCEGWAVRDLVVHLLVREGSLTGLATAVPTVGALARRLGRPALADAGFPELVAALRSGPPILSPFAVPGLGAALNGLEYFVHHEDVRRAQPGWTPRTLPAATEDGLWRLLKVADRPLVRRSAVAVRVRRADTGPATEEQQTVQLHRGTGGVLLTGPPSELVLHLFGR